MPNYVMNLVKMRGITNLPVFTEKEEWGGRKVPSLDFEKIIPIPESLNADSSSLEPLAMEAAIRKAVASAKQPFGARLNPAMSDIECKHQLSRCGTMGEALCELGLRYLQNLILYGASTWYDYMTIGDWNGDGRGLNRSYLIFSNAPVEIFREAHIKTGYGDHTPNWGGGGLKCIA